MMAFVDITITPKTLAFWLIAAYILGAYSGTWFQDETNYQMYVYCMGKLAEIGK